MKAKFIALNGLMTLILANGTSFNSVEKETKAKFLKRVQADVDLDLGELEVEELTTASFSKLTGAQLNTAAAKEKAGLLKDLLSLAASEKDDAPKVKEPKVANVKEPKVAKVKEDKKEVLESAIALTEASQANVGHYATFSPHNTAIKTEGIIRAAWIDKRIPAVYYRIYTSDNKMYNKNVKDLNLQIGELAPDAKAEKAAEKKAKEIAKVEANIEKEAAKLAEKKAKSEAKESAKTEKEISKKSNAIAIAEAKEEAIQKAIAER